MRASPPAGLQMTDNNARQADVLDGSEILENTRGTAPGQWLDTVYGGHRKLVILLPGPPNGSEGHV